MEQLGLWRRVPVVAAMVGVLVGVPLVAGAVAAGRPGAQAAGLGGLFTMLVVVRAGRRTATWVLPLLVLAIAAGALTVGTWAWVVLLGAIGVAAGLGATRGLLVPLAWAGMLAASTPPLAPGEDLLVRLGIAAVAGGYVIVVSGRLGLPDEVPLQRAPQGEALAIAVVLGAAVSIAATVALRSSDPHAYWIPVSVFVLSMPTPGVRLHVGAGQRFLGTLAGLLAAIPVALVGVPGGLLLVASVILLLLVLAVPRPLWLNAALTTALIVTLLDAPTGRVSAGAMRLLDVAIAAALVLLGLAALTWWGRRRGPGPLAGVGTGALGIGDEGTGDEGTGDEGR